MNSFEPTQTTIEYKQKIDKLGRASATGRRKSSVARVWIKPGTGKFVVNKLELDNYFRYQSLSEEVREPLRATFTIGKFDVFSTVVGGGTTGQAGALKLGISRALQNFDPEFRTPLKADGLLTRDSREVERKKYGKKKARKSFQFSKR